MTQVLSGFAVVWVIILVGVLVGRTGVLGEHGRTVLSRAAFFIGNPALLFVTLSRADVGAVLGPQLWVATLSAFTAAALYLAVTVPLLKGRSASERIMSALSASLVNSANLGIPIAAYVLGDAALAAPALIFQLAIYTPIYLALMDIAVLGRRPNPLSLLRSVATNPMILGSLLGVVFSATGWQLPTVAHQPIELISGMV